ncbi:uncharacterized protein [Ptychodera flava]|uniref:uncharacterized protein n=1 Tax=Ptychodera flava TaxID=63121 RepID=UPI00396A1767
MEERERLYLETHALTDQPPVVEDFTVVEGKECKVREKKARKKRVAAKSSKSCQTPVGVAAARKSLSFLNILQKKWRFVFKGDRKIYMEKNEQPGRGDGGTKRVAQTVGEAGREAKPIANGKYAENGDKEKEMEKACADKRDRGDTEINRAANDQGSNRQSSGFQPTAQAFVPMSQKLCASSAAVTSTTTYKPAQSFTTSVWSTLSHPLQHHQPQNSAVWFDHQQQGQQQSFFFPPSSFRGPTNVHQQPAMQYPGGAPLWYNPCPQPQRPMCARVPSMLENFQGPMSYDQRSLRMGTVMQRPFVRYIHYEKQRTIVSVPYPRPQNPRWFHPHYHRQCCPPIQPQAVPTNNNVQQYGDARIASVKFDASQELTQNSVNESENKSTVTDVITSADKPQSDTEQSIHNQRQPSGQGSTKDYPPTPSHAPSMSVKTEVNVDQSLTIANQPQLDINLPRPNEDHSNVYYLPCPNSIALYPPSDQTHPNANGTSQVQRNQYYSSVEQNLLPNIPYPNEGQQMPHLACPKAMPLGPFSNHLSRNSNQLNLNANLTTPIPNQAHCYNQQHQFSNHLRPCINLPNQLRGSSQQQLGINNNTNKFLAQGSEPPGCSETGNDTSSTLYSNLPFSVETLEQDVQRDLLGTQQNLPDDIEQRHQRRCRRGLNPEVAPFVLETAGQKSALFQQSVNKDGTLAQNLGITEGDSGESPV